MRFTGRQGAWLCALLLIILSAVVAYTAGQQNAAENANWQATSEFNYKNPSPLPAFILSTRTFPKNDGRVFCLTVYQGAFWEEGDNPQDLQSHLTDNAIFTINDQTIPNPSISISAMFPKDENGNITEKFGGNMDFCYLLGFLAGIYTATFESTDLHDNIHSYTWALEISGQEQAD